MDLNHLLLGGAALGVLAGAWGHIKAVFFWFVGLLIRRVEIHTEEAHQAIIAYLIAHHKRSRNYESMYGADHVHQRNGRYGLVPYEQYGNRTLIFWSGWVPFFYSNELERKARTAGNKNDNHSDDATKVYSTITFLRGTVDVEGLLRKACTESNQLTWSVTSAQEEAKNRFVIHHVPNRKDDDHGSSSGSNGLAWYQQKYYRLLSHRPEELGKAPTHDGRALDNLIYPQRVKDLIKEIELWRNHRSWYRHKGIPWKRGWLLYGPPGTGKTALARAFAEDLNMPIYVFNLAEMGNHDLIKAWGEMQVNVPCIALIEDIDNVFQGRENISRKNLAMPLMLGRAKNDKEDRVQPLGPLTFDCLLNCLDGVERADGVFTIMTTNDISKVDPALGQPRRLPDGTVEFISTRPGRIDKAVELTYMEPDDKKRMAARILAEYPEQYQEMVEFVDRFPELQETPAQFQERCGQIALARFWKEQKSAEQATLEPAPPRTKEPARMSFWGFEWALNGQERRNGSN
jgi:hypothetical protein